MVSGLEPRETAKYCKKSAILTSIEGEGEGGIYIHCKAGAISMSIDCATQVDLFQYLTKKVRFQ